MPMLLVIRSNDECFLGPTQMRNPQNVISPDDFSSFFSMNVNENITSNIQWCVGKAQAFYLFPVFTEITKC